MIAVKALAMTLLVFPAAAGANIFKWVDEKGVVHYGDSIPPEYVNRGTVEMNAKGRALKRTEPALTPEQVRAIENDRANKEQQDKLDREQKRKDDALLATYTSVKEIDQLRARNVGSIEALIKGAQNRIAELKRRKTELEQQSAGKKAAPPDVQRELRAIDQELPVQQGLADQKTKELATISAKFDSERRRFEELKSGSAAAAAETRPVTK
jgi:hypothetical protein